MITEFRGRYRFLSNFYPCQICFSRDWYPSVEHAYVAAKTTDPVQRLNVQGMTAGQAKKYGRTFSLRSDWGEIRLEVMEDFLRQKFRRPDLQLALLATKDQVLQEGNYWGDVYWGVCRGVGENNLGRLLMKIRKDLSHG